MTWPRQRPCPRRNGDTDAIWCEICTFLWKHLKHNETHDLFLFTLIVGQRLFDVTRTGWDPSGTGVQVTRRMCPMLCKVASDFKVLLPLFHFSKMVPYVSIIYPCFHGFHNLSIFYHIMSILFPSKLTLTSREGARGRWWQCHLVAVRIPFVE
jgi:hypothetical protein